MRPGCEPAAKGRRLGERTLFRRAGEPLLVAGSLDDLVAVAKTRACLEHALLVPERSDALVERMQLGREFRVVALREEVPELGAALGGAVDLFSDLVDIGHACSNEVTTAAIP